ncbi:hypothetical protein SKAU_G00098290 [Synaphobranchus kaupii]|uniref:Uncharacterized protein n=1 Tax=Synaphobranchus kaupii TaxID=118154 RepID=A0A9Q1FZ17_SYNKA|nr:hypothetical protein SKAU_G00098290 [Synaphobranchus kaupii]
MAENEAEEGGLTSGEAAKEPHCRMRSEDGVAVAGAAVQIPRPVTQNGLLELLGRGASIPRLPPLPGRSSGGSISRPKQSLLKHNAVPLQTLVVFQEIGVRVIRIPVQQSPAVLLWGATDASAGRAVAIVGGMPPEPVSQEDSKSRRFGSRNSASPFPGASLSERCQRARRRHVWLAQQRVSGGGGGFSVLTFTVTAPSTAAVEFDEGVGARASATSHVLPQPHRLDHVKGRAPDGISPRVRFSNRCTTRARRYVEKDKDPSFSRQTVSNVPNALIHWVNGRPQTHVVEMAGC